MRRLGAVVLGGAMVVGMAGPAWGHAELENGPVKRGTEAALSLHVAVEREGAVNDKVTVSLPEIFEAHSCTAESGWSCSVDPGMGAGAIITFTRLGEAHTMSAGHDDEPAAPEDEGHTGELFAFTVHTPKEKGTYALKVGQTYSTGEVVNWDGAADSENPAPTLQVK